MGIENAKLVAVPVKRVTKDIVLAEIRRCLEPALKLVADAFDTVDFKIPVFVSNSGEDGGSIFDKIYQPEFEHCTYVIPSQEEVEECVKAEVENVLWKDSDIKTTVDYYYDGDTFDLVVTFESVEPEPVGPIDREKMAEKLHGLIEEGVL
jgi:hypothetical protein